MYRYEVGFRNADGVYQWKCFKYVDKFEKFLKTLRKKGLEIIDISDWDSEGIGKKLKAEYLG